MQVVLFNILHGWDAARARIKYIVYILLDPTGVWETSPPRDQRSHGTSARETRRAKQLSAGPAGGTYAPAKAQSRCLETGRLPMVDSLAYLETYTQWMAYPNQAIDLPRDLMSKIPRADPTSRSRDQIPWTRSRRPSITSLHVLCSHQY